MKIKKNIPKPTYFGSNLKLIRRMAGISQTKLAEIVGLSRNNIASYESGMVEPKAVNFIKVCEFFNVLPSDMLSKDLSQKPLQVVKVQNNEKSGSSGYVKDELEKFVNQTNDMTKVYEGYISFMKMKKDLSGNIDNSGLQIIFEDLLQLLNSSISNNWNLIQSFEGANIEEE